MENREGFVPETESKEMQWTRELFSKNTEINADNLGYFSINTILDDHPICEGGQNVNMNLTIEEICFDATSQGDGKTESYILFKVNDFWVNGINLMVDGVDFYLGREKRIDQEKRLNDCNIFTVGKDGMILNHEENSILAFGMNTGLAVAAYMHELGHFMRDDMVDIKKDELENIIKNTSEVIDTAKESEGELTSNQIELHRMAVYEERQASLKALELVKKHKELFPKDPDLSKLKRTYSHTLETYMHSQKSFKGQEFITVMDFDQDWHY